MASSLPTESLDASLPTESLDASLPTESLDASLPTESLDALPTESLDALPTERVITVVCDGYEFSIDYANAIKSGVLKAACTDSGEDIIPIPTNDFVNRRTMYYVVQYLKNHTIEGACIHKPLRPNKEGLKLMSWNCKDPFDAEFIENVYANKDGVSLEDALKMDDVSEITFQNDFGEIYNLVNTANYMDINGLVHLCSALIVAKTSPLAETPSSIEAFIVPMREQWRAMKSLQQVNNDADDSDDEVKSDD